MKDVVDKLDFIFDPYKPKLNSLRNF